MESPSDSSYGRVAPSNDNICTTSNAVLFTTHQHTPKSLQGVAHTGFVHQHSHTEPSHPVARELTSLTTVVDDVTTAARLCEVLLSRGLGDPALTSSLTSSRRTVDHCRSEPLPPPSAELVRSVERVQTIPYLVDEIKRAAAGHAHDARQETSKFIERIEAEKQKAKAAAAGSQLLASLQDTITDSEKPEVIIAAQLQSTNE